MSSSFFKKKESALSKKRKLQLDPSSSRGRGGRGKSQGNRKLKPKTNESSKLKYEKVNEEISSDEGNDNDVADADIAPNLTYSDEEVEQETAQDKRLRLAKEYLKEIEKQELERLEDKEASGGIQERLHHDYLDSVGRLQRYIAESIKSYDSSNIRTYKHKKHHLSVCALALSSDDKYMFAGAKSQFVLKWNTDTLKLEGTIDIRAIADECMTDNVKVRRQHVIAICLSSDMKFLAIADGGNNIQIWCPQTLKHLKTFKGHRDIVTALVFRRGTHDLYSASKDRSVKIWSLNEMAYVESLFGHQSGITGIDALSRERAITSGGTDCSLRVWKITEESQLIFNGHRDSIENVKFVNEESFVSSGTDGSICFWSALKKKPLSIETFVHGKQKNGVANWITAIACVINTDLIATGSCDGSIRLWQIVKSTRKLKQILQIPMVGFINHLVFNQSGTKLFAAVGQEHRLGRWWCIKETKNKIVCIDLLQNIDS